MSNVRNDQKHQSNARKESITAPAANAAFHSAQQPVSTLLPQQQESLAHISHLYSMLNQVNILRNIIIQSAEISPKQYSDFQLAKEKFTTAKHLFEKTFGMTLSGPQFTIANLPPNMNVKSFSTHQSQISAPTNDEDDISLGSLDSVELEEQDILIAQLKTLNIHVPEKNNSSIRTTTAASTANPSANAPITTITSINLKQKTPLSLNHEQQARMQQNKKNENKQNSYSPRKNKLTAKITTHNKPVLTEISNKTNILFHKPSAPKPQNTHPKGSQTSNTTSTLKVKKKTQIR